MHAKADFLLRYHSSLRYWCFLAECVLSQLTIHSLSPSLEKVWGIQSLWPPKCWAWYSSGYWYSAATLWFFPPVITCFLCQLCDLKQLMHAESLFLFLLVLHGSSVTKPNISWCETDGWENLLGIVIFVTNTGFLISLFVYSRGSWVAWVSCL